MGHSETPPWTHISPAASKAAVALETKECVNQDLVRHSHCLFLGTQSPQRPPSNIQDLRNLNTLLSLLLATGCAAQAQRSRSLILKGPDLCSQIHPDKATRVHLGDALTPVSAAVLKRA